MPYGLPGLGGPPPPIDHLANYHRLAMYPPGSRERLELELERDKRERDARERELRERELREMEMREKMKAEMDLKPPAGAGGGHVPGVYPPVSLANELVAREREKLERLDVQQLEAMSTRFIYQYYSQRLTSDQLVYMQRVTNEFYLRTKQEKGLVDPSQLIYQFSRADPLSGLQSSSATPSSLSSLHPSAQPLLHGATSREQELLQRELYSRAYMDPALAHQLSAQAHHEAIQRQLALERERFGATGHLPH
nr:hypothetical protein BaRGS_033477 [Batillaria attramentaria]